MRSQLCRAEADIGDNGKASCWRKFHVFMGVGVLWLLLLVFVVGIAVGAHWLFRQRTPDEIRASRETLRKWRNRSK